MKNWRKISLYSMAIFYTVAGVNHFLNPDFYKPIMPPWLPWHYPLIYCTGVMEIIAGLLLLPVQTRRLAAWGVIVLLLLIFPANVQMMLNYQRDQHPHLWMAVLRLPLQVVLVVWAWQFAKKG